MLGKISGLNPVPAEQTTARPELAADILPRATELRAAAAVLQQNREMNAVVPSTEERIRTQLATHYKSSYRGPHVLAPVVERTPVQPQQVAKELQPVAPVVSPAEQSLTYPVPHTAVISERPPLSVIPEPTAELSFEEQSRQAVEAIYRDMEQAA